MASKLFTENTQKIVNGIKALTEQKLLLQDYEDIDAIIIGDKKIEDLSLSDVRYMYDVLKLHERSLNKVSMSMAMLINPHLRKEELKDGTFHHDGRRFIIPISHIKTLKGWAGVYQEGENYYAYNNTGYLLADYCAQNDIGVSEAFIDAIYELTQNFAASLTLDNDYEIKSNIKRDLFEFQKAGVEYILNTKRTFVCDQMGCGKTTEAIVAIIEADAFPCICIVPSVVKYNWELEWNDITDEKKVVVLEDMDEFEEADVYITNYENLPKYTNYTMRRKKKKSDRDAEKKEIKELEELMITVGGKKIKKQLSDKRAEYKRKSYDVNYKPIHGVDMKEYCKSVVIDESHYIKTPDAIRTKLCEHYTEYKQWVLLLTGTPIVNHSQEIISQLQVLNRLDEFGGFIKFATRYANFGKHTIVTKKGHNMRRRTYKLPKTQQERDEYNYLLRELSHRLRSTCFLRRLKRDVLKQLPEKTRKIIPTPLTNMQKYADASDDLMGYLMEHEDYDEDRINRIHNYEDLIKVGKLKQLCGVGKVDAVYKYCKNLIDDGEKVVLFAHHQEIVSKLVKRFDDALFIIGEQSAEEKQKAVEDFQNDPDKKIIICSIMAASVGVTLTASSNVVFAEIPWTPSEIEQAEDRCHRIGQENNVTISYMIAKTDREILNKDSIETTIMRVIDKKREVSENMTNTVDEIKMEVLEEFITDE